MKKKRLLRLVSAVMLLALSLSVFVGCKSGDDDETETTDTQASIVSDAGKIIDNGVSNYTLVYPDGCSPAVTAAMEKFVGAVAEATGVTLETKSDYKTRTQVYDPTKSEILFGKTGYDETDEVLKTLADDQYAIRAVGKKIVFVAARDENLDALVTYFCDNLLQKNVVEGDSGKSLLLEEYTSTAASEAEVLIGSEAHSLSEYSIVYDAQSRGYDTVAQHLRDLLETKYGVTIPVYADSAQSDGGACEILVGKTNRAFSQTVFTAKNPEIMTYEVSVSGKKVQLLSGGVFSARQCANAMYAGAAQLKNDGDFFATELASVSQAVTENADLRVMTCNVLADIWVPDALGAANYGYSAVERAEIFTAMLVSYTPDIIGLQEAYKEWSALIPGILATLKSEYGIEYTWVYDKYTKENTDYDCMTSMLYRSDKYELDASKSGIVPTSYWEQKMAEENRSYYCRVFEWLYLTEKTGTDKFCVVNTHWELSERTEWVQLCINEEIALINDLRSRYSVPIICTGDFNCKQDTEDYNRFIAEASLEETCKLAETAGTLANKVGGCGELGKVRKEGNYIDHIFASSGTCDVLRYETVTGSMTQFMSDHSAQYADVKFK